MTTPLPLLALPSMLVKQIFEESSSYFPFALSLLSKKAARIVHALSVNRQLLLSVSLNYGIQRLVLAENNTVFNLLFLEQIPDTPARVDLKLPGISDEIPAAVYNIPGLTDGVSLMTVWEDSYRGIEYMIGRMEKVFKNVSVNINYGVENKMALNVITNAVKDCNWQISSYNSDNVYSLEEVMEMSLFVKDEIQVAWPNMVEEEMQMFFKFWMEEDNMARHVTFNNPPDGFNVNELARVVDPEPEQSDEDYLTVKRADGQTANLRFSQMTIEFVKC